MSEKETTPKTEAFWKDAEAGLYGGRQKRLDVPTYDPDSEKEWDWSRAREVTIADELGLRVIMGDPVNVDSPNVCVERAADRWRLFIHIDGGDPFCYIEITDTEAVILTDRGGDKPLLHQERVL